MTSTIRVSIRPYVYQNIAGYRVKWVDPDTNEWRNFFVKDEKAAKALRTRVHAGKKGLGKTWGVRIA